MDDQDHPVFCSSNVLWILQAGRRDGPDEHPEHGLRHDIRNRVPNLLRSGRGHLPVEKLETSRLSRLNFCLTLVRSHRENPNHAPEHPLPFRIESGPDSNAHRTEIIYNKMKAKQSLLKITVRNITFRVSCPLRGYACKTDHLDDVHTGIRQPREDRQPPGVARKTGGVRVHLGRRRLQPNLHLTQIEY